MSPIMAADGKILSIDILVANMTFCKETIMMIMLIIWRIYYKIFMHSIKFTKRE